MAEWSSATTAATLVLVKVGLGIRESTTAYDAALTSKIETAKDEIERQGVIDLADDPQSKELVAAFAGWLWTNRNKEGTMPVYLRKMLNNRIFGPRMRTS